MRRLEFFKNKEMADRSRWSCPGGPWEWSDEEDKRTTSMDGIAKRFLANSRADDTSGVISNGCCERKLKCLGQAHSSCPPECLCWCSQWWSVCCNPWSCSIEACSTEALASFSRQQQKVRTKKNGRRSKTLIILLGAFFIKNNITLKYRLVKV